MPPLFWGSQDQLEFLSGRLADFQAAQRDKSTAAFWPVISRDFFVRWPDQESERRSVAVPKKNKKKKGASSTPDLTNAEWITKRKDQIQNWYNNRGNGSTHRRSGPSIVIGSTATQRIPSEVALYSKKYYNTKIQSIVAGVVRRDNIDKTHRIAVVNKCTLDAWNAESDEVKDEIRNEVAKIKEEASREAPLPGPRTPEEYASALVTMPKLITAFLKEMNARTGWSFTILAGGPEPAREGKIRTIAVHEGEDRFEQIFSVANPDFFTHVLGPFQSFLYNVYPPEVCDMFALGSKARLSETATDDGPSVIPTASDAGPGGPPAPSVDDAFASAGLQASATDGAPVIPPPPTTNSAPVTLIPPTTVEVQAQAVPLPPSIVNPIASGAQLFLRDPNNEDIHNNVAAFDPYAFDFGPPFTFSDSELAALPNVPGWDEMWGAKNPTGTEAQGSNPTLDASLVRNVFTDSASSHEIAPPPIGAKAILGQMGATIGTEAQVLHPVFDAPLFPSVFADSASSHEIVPPSTEASVIVGQTGTTISNVTQSVGDLTRGERNVEMDQFLHALNANPVFQYDRACPVDMGFTGATMPAPGESMTTPVVLDNHDKSPAVMDDILPESIRLPTGIAIENTERVPRNRKPAASKDVQVQSAWLDLASAYLKNELDIPKWQECVRLWEDFERKEASELNTSSVRIPAKARPALLSKWLTTRKYSSMTSVPDSELAAFADTWLTWWNSVQPKWRRNPGTAELPLGLDVAKGKEDMSVLRSGGPSGLVVVLIGLKWWAGLHSQNGRWESAVMDITTCLQSFDTVPPKRKRAAAAEQDGDKKGKKKKT